MSTYGVHLTEHDEIYSPPGRVLEVTVVGEIVFLSIYDYEETHDTTSCKNGASFGVNLVDLIAAINTFAPLTVE